MSGCWMHCRHRRRNDAAAGMTMVELLVTMMIIGILAGAVLFSMNIAAEAARKSRTQALIATLHSLLIENWESYLTRRNNRSYVAETSTTNRKSAALLRLTGIRQMLKMDFPERWEDIYELSNGTDSIPAINTSALHQYYLSRWNAIKSHPDAERYEHAECLFMVINAMRGEGAMWRKVSEANIGDLDGDGAPEYLDGWGRPINFLRWPAGFESDMQSGQRGILTDTALAATDAARLDHDPFDPLRVDEKAYRLVPLIISAGPDALFDISVLNLDYSNTTDVNNRWNPYHRKADQFGVLRRSGEVFDDAPKNSIDDSNDNIHNHLISTR